MIVLITEEILRFISETFIGDIDKNLYSRKSGPQIHAFFEKYFGYKNDYWEVKGQPSRWKIGFDKLALTLDEGKFNKFFSITLGIQYLNL